MGDIQRNFLEYSKKSHHHTSAGQCQKNTRAHVANHFKSRLKFFKRFPIGGRIKVYYILYGNDTHENMVNLVCKVLDLSYTVDRSERSDFLEFEASGNYEFAFVEKSAKLWEQIVSFLKTMFNFRELVHTCESRL